LGFTAFFTLAAATFGVVAIAVGAATSVILMMFYNFVENVRVLNIT